MIDYWNNLSLENLFYIAEDGRILEEEWRDIHDWEGFYQSSILGRIKSLERIVDRGAAGSTLIKNRILKQKKVRKKNGLIYLHVNLSDKKRTSSYSVHQLTGISFLNHKPCGFKVVVDHINDNSLDNRASNLQLLTSRGNVSKSKRGVTGVTGVTISSSGKFESGIKHLSKKYYLGVFETLKEAEETYCLALSLIEKGESFDFLLKEKKVSNTGHVGIRKVNNKKHDNFHVRFTINGVVEHIGVYPTLEDAILAKENRLKEIK